MIFTYKTRNNTAIPQEKPKVLPINHFSRRPMGINPPYTQMLSKTTPSDGDRMKWGAPTWTLFHCIPEKISDENFTKHKDSIIRTIVTICNNLPCPSCSSHATQYMKKVNFLAIKTKDDLKKMLFVFHNSVNERKGYSQYSYDNLDEKYDNLDFTKVLNEFMFHFQKKTYAPNLISEQIYRQHQVQIIKKWFKDNMHIFQ